MYDFAFYTVENFEQTTPDGEKVIRHDQDIEVELPQRLESSNVISGKDTSVLSDFKIY